MAGNSRRRGAVRKQGKGPSVGSGGQRRKGLEGRGPTPKAADREHHPAHRRAAPDRTARPGGYAGGSRHQGRRAKGVTEVVAGRNAVVEALRAGVPVTTMFVAARIDADDRVREALKTAGERGIPILESPRGELDRLSDSAVHQGLALQVPPFAYADPADLRAPLVAGLPLLVALDGVTDVRNLGAVVRSVAAFGGHGVLLPERRSAGMTAAAWKASAGAAARVPVARVSNLTRALADFQKAGFFVVGLDTHGGVALPGLELADRPLVLVVGSEGRGLSRLVAQTCDLIAAIPMAGRMESLNAGVAAGIALYEVQRVRTAH
ncbi:MAG: 23S rRNA (guanosine(2251)-2'-O)-methyltransferase RlmB [Dermatophilaceae bacterium]